MRSTVHGVEDLVFDKPLVLYFCLYLRMPKSLSTALIFEMKQLNIHAAYFSFIANKILKGLTKFNPLNAQLIPIYHLLALLGAHHIFHVSGLRVNVLCHIL